LVTGRAVDAEDLRRLTWRPGASETSKQSSHEILLEAERLKNHSGLSRGQTTRSACSPGGGRAYRSVVDTSRIARTPSTSIPISRSGDKA
jgi:hypothetical protein